MPPKRPNRKPSYQGPQAGGGKCGNSTVGNQRSVSAPVHPASRTPLPSNAQGAGTTSIVPQAVPAAGPLGEPVVPPPTVSAAETTPNRVIRRQESVDILNSTTNNFNSGNFSRFARWFDGSGDPSEGLHPQNPTAEPIRQADSTSAATPASGATTQTAGSADDSALDEAKAKLATVRRSIESDPDAITPAPPIEDTEEETLEQGPPVDGPAVARTTLPLPTLAIPVIIGDHPAPGAHQHRMGFTRCEHGSGGFVECEETNPRMCVYNKSMKWRGQCADCHEGYKGIKGSMKRIGSWISRTASRITHRNRGSVRGVFDQGEVVVVAPSRGGGGDGAGSGRDPVQRTDHSARPSQRGRRQSSMRGPTGSSVGAGGFDPNIQEDTESDKS
ncbi:hypothetical protein DRE_05379 [Drechslerella stenobrocha 248]|uniref:Uncharacterized protein n=1 Tax=Drechslerella stenobrocha 248 TaxID=1043628 RepID=W7HNB4_9PEZI|nr:hypothetical protein DRE_05379 [Drechslerella stenobrocha 248]